MLSTFKMLLQSPVPEEKGDLILSSTFTDIETKEVKAAKAYSGLLVIGNEFIPYNFDLRFAIKDREITFTFMDDSVSFGLEEDDHFKWRDTLKQFLNQKGFHEQFKPIKKIGKGNFASVYLVEKLENKLKYAVKAFSKEAAYSEENGKECLIKQIQIMRHLNHQNNMKLYEVFESDNSLYIVFELLEGGQLYEKIKSKQKFKPRQIKTMIKGILEGLREMHSKNIMHRDLKPENILLRSEKDYDCVIADYGLAEFADSQEYLFVRCGTPGYVAPEVINIKDMKTKYSPICDMFSLGLIFHLLIFGKSVFKGKTYNQVLTQNRACSYDLNSAEYDGVDPEIMDLLKKMLRTNPEERITAEQAISHPYFKDFESNEEEDQNIMQQMKDSVLPTDTESPLMTTKNQKRRENKHVKKDSCLDFKMARDNIFTGQTKTLGTFGSGKVSGFGAELIKGVKMSKYVRPNQAENKQNH